jgi:hypothetical protein
MTYFSVNNATHDESSSRLRLLQGEFQKRWVVREFASLFYMELLKSLRMTVPDGGLIGNDSLSSDVYTSILDHEIARVAGQRDTDVLGRLISNALDKRVAASVSELTHFFGDSVVNSTVLHNGKACVEAFACAPPCSGEMPQLVSLQVTA